MIIKTDNSFSARWSPEIRMRGFVEVPNCIIKCQKELGITNPEAWVLICIMQYRFTCEMPFPSIETLARDSDKSVSAIRHTIRSLEKKGVIKRHHVTRQANRYDFEPLIDLLMSHSCQIDVKKQLRKRSETATATYSNTDTQQYEVEIIQPNKKINQTASLTYGTRFVDDTNNLGWLENYFERGSNDIIDI